VRQAAARLDRAVDRLFDSLRGRPLADRLFYDASELADFSLLWHLIGVARGLRSDRHAREAVRLSACLGVESVLVNGLVKSLFRRARPVWREPRPRRLRRPRTSSFPSGHASASFCAATLLSERDRAWPLYYALAAVVAASRVHVKIHHASDTLAGIFLGLAIGRTFRRIWAVRPE
jgi:undecaprenyl-diphosphatase